MFRRLIELLDKEGRTQYAWLIVMSIVSSLLQALGVASVSAFFTLLLEGEMPKVVENYTGISSISTFGIVVLGLIAMGTASSAFTTYYGYWLSWSHYSKISRRLLTQYLNNDYQWHLTTSSSDLIKTVVVETQSIVASGLQQSVLIVVRGAEMFFVGLLLCFVRPSLALVNLSLFVLIYGTMFYTKRNFLAHQSKRALDGNEKRHRYARESLSGVKAVKVSENQKFFVDRFEEGAQVFSSSVRKIQTFAALPRYLVEFVIFGGLIGFVVISTSRGWNSSESISLLALYGAAAVKLLPAAQQIYSSLAIFTGAQACLSKVVDGMNSRVRPQSSTDRLVPLEDDSRDLLRLEKVSYSYPESDETVLKELDLSIREGEKVAVVGATGAGKTTLIDMILNLLAPSSGRLLRGKNKRIGYVPQQLYFVEGSIAENIALGENKESWDPERIRSAARRAGIAEHIEALPGGYDTFMGDQGTRLSGGQRQRVGIARALYSQPDLLVLDEASNALDAETEKRVISTLLKEDITLVIITHRLSVLKDCERVIFLEKGQISEEGSFQEVVATNEHFKVMVEADTGA